MTLTESSRSLLIDWHPRESDQQALREDFLHHIDGHDQPWSRDCLPDHLTASLLVVDPARTRVLLGLHRKVGLWLQFGGHIEPSDLSVVDAALREAREESGLAAITLDDSRPVRLDRHAAPCGPQARHHLDVQMVGVADPLEPIAVSAESLAVEWFDIGGLPEQTDDAVRRLVDSACG